jgi:cell division septation protein DedD
VSGAANDVSNPHEPSYYEIALTNRQVIVAFVILLVCLVSAFFSGVWIGRESGARAAAEQMVRNAPPPEEEKKEGQNLEEFEFFDSGKNAKAAGGDRAKGAPAPAPSPAPPPPAQSTAQSSDSTLAEDFGVEDEDPEAAPRAAVEPTPRDRRGRQKPEPAEQTTAATPKPERTVQAKAPASETPARPGRRTETAAPEPARGAGQVVIQVFSSSEKDQAVKIRDRLVSGGQKAYLSPVEVAGRTMYRVRIGPFDSRDRAQKVAEQVRKGYKLDTWVTE